MTLCSRVMDMLVWTIQTLPLYQSISYLNVIFNTHLTSSHLKAFRDCFQSNCRVIIQPINYFLSPNRTKLCKRRQSLRMLFNWQFLIQLSWHTSQFEGCLITLSGQIRDQLSNEWLNLVYCISDKNNWTTNVIQNLNIFIFKFNCNAD